MDFLVQAVTDIGISKSTNQDSLGVKVINTSMGKMVFAVLCDGMGGLAKGEIASASLVNAFSVWAQEELPKMTSNTLSDGAIRNAWENIVIDYNIKIANYGKSQGIKLGTTVSAILITESRYYILNVGDTRVYEVYDNLYQLTHDQTLIQKEIDDGRISEQEALTDPRRSILLQCVGASEAVYPEMFFGETKLNAVYMLCTDGFRHEITGQEIYDAFNPNVLVNTDIMKVNTERLIELNKSRMENDNITVALIRTF